MTTEKNRNNLTLFFASLFHSFPKLLFTNLLFAVPLAVFSTIFILINYLTGLNTMVILLLTIIPLFPFYAGVTLVTSKLVRNDTEVNVFESFVIGVRDNFVRFLVHGIVIYLAVLFSYYSITLYCKFGASNGTFYALLVISIIIAVVFLFMFFYISPMTVTFDISMKNIYKNSFLMSFGELKHNFFAVFGLIIVALVCATVLLCCGVSSIAIIIATAILSLFFVPSIISFIINSAVYRVMYDMIASKDKKSQTIDKKIDNRRNGILDDTENKTVSLEEYLNADVDETKDGNEYVYFNGKMMKRSVLLKLKKEALIQAKNKGDNKDEC